MARPSEAYARARSGTPPAVGERCHPEPGMSNPALAAALDRALLTVQYLRDALDAAARQQAEPVTQLILARALAEPGTTPNAVRATVPPRVRPRDAPSPREREVLRLLATGHSNRRIAAALCLSPRTVQRHVANVYLKIGAHCRAEATAFALRHHLA